MAEVVKNQLLESHLERTFGVINLALVDGSPQVLDLKQTLEYYVEHRRDVVRRRSEHELAEREDRAHILKGRLKALEQVDDVVETIQNSDDRDAAKAALEADYEFSEAQAEHIVRMQLGSLTSMETQEIESEYEDVTARIERLETILGDPDELDQVIITELREIKDEYDDERRTSFIEDVGDVTHEDLIPEEECVVVMSEDDYIKRMSLDTFRAQNRGGKGSSDRSERGRPRLLRVRRQLPRLPARLHQPRADLRVEDLRDPGDVSDRPRQVRGQPHRPRRRRGDRGGGEHRRSRRRRVPHDGHPRRVHQATAVDQFGNIRSTGIRAIRLEDGDELVDVEVTNGGTDIVIGSRNGMAIRFAESEARAMGRTARGVIGIDLREGDAVAGVAAIDEDRHNWVLTVTENGYGKRSDLDEYRLQSRNGKGLIDIKTGDRNGEAVAIEAVTYGDHLLAMSDNGQIMRTRVEEISTVGRNTKGVIVMNLDPDDTVASVDIVSESVHGGETDVEGDE